MLQNSLKLAYTLGIISEYNADKIKRPKATEKKVECFSLSEQKKIEQYVLENKHAKLFGILLCLYTGLRIRELLALEWNDVDMTKAELTVNRTCHFGKDKTGKYTRMTDTPKTTSSARTIPLPKQIIPTEAIAKNPNWTFAGIYADEGITGTATTKRKDFLRLMRDCEKGKVDFILAKSVSRFARNTVDSLMWTRKLREKGIGVYFGEQALDSLKAENEMLIGLFSVIAQSESENITANVKWGVQQRMRSGTYMTNFNCYGYRKGDDGIPVIVEEEALIIKKIYQLFIDGYSMKQISGILKSEEVKTYSGKLQWEPEHIQRILTNEKYIAVYAFKTNRTEDVVTFDDEKAEVLKEVYRGLNRMGVHTEHITVKETHLETQENGSVVPVEQEVVKTYLYINTVSLTAEEAANLYGFDAKQREQLGELLLDRNKDMWDALLLQQ